MTETPSTNTAMDELMANVAAIRHKAAPEKYASELAIGVFSDDLSDESSEAVAGDTAGLVAVVYQGRLYNLSISDWYLSAGPEVLTANLNAVLINAMTVWRMQYVQLIKEGRAVLDEHGDAAGEQILDQRIAEELDAD